MADQNKVLITGVSGNIGYELAKLFAEDGVQVHGTCRMINDRTEELCDLGVKVHELDMRAIFDVKMCASRLRNEGVNTLVLNAGKFIIGDYSDPNFKEKEINAFGVHCEGPKAAAHSFVRAHFPGDDSENPLITYVSSIVQPYALGKHHGHKEHDVLPFPIDPYTTSKVAGAIAIDHIVRRENLHRDEGNQVLRFVPILGCVKTGMTVDECEAIRPYLEEESGEEWSQERIEEEVLKGFNAGTFRKDGVLEPRFFSARETAQFIKDGINLTRDKGYSLTIAQPGTFETAPLIGEYTPRALDVLVRDGSAKYIV